jgi:hypothetical protein
MATFTQNINRIDPNLDVNKKGAIVDPGPYEGIVKNNNDVRRTGRMDVYIPTFGGDETDPRSWIPVAYMSPFMGQTNKTLLDKNETSALYSYGMWMTVPDPGTKVVVTFLEGSRINGVVIGCLIDNINNHMVPGFASSKNWIKSDEIVELLPTYEPQKDFLPVLEFNPSIKRDTQQPNSIARPVNIELVKILKEQGLIGDHKRGQSFSTSQREGNSAVYGFATPGRPANDPAVNEPLKQRMQNGEATAEDLEVRKRMPGHSFVLDDGDIEGNSKLIRLRTSTGHQLLLNDTDGMIYVGTASGNAWIEMTNNGDVHVYNKGSLNIHSEGNFNVHAGGNINMEATGGINVSSMGASGIKVQAAEGGVDMYSELGTNNESAGAVHTKAGTNITMTSENPESIHMNGPEANAAVKPTRNDLLTGNNNRDVLNSTSTTVPEHEPWNRGGE